MREIFINLTMLGQKAKGIERYAKEILTRCEDIPEYKRLPITYLFGKNNSSEWNSIKGGKCLYLPNIFSVDKAKVYGLVRYFIPPIILPKGSVIFNPSYQGFLFSKNQILTILDIIPLTNPNQRKHQYLAFKYFLPILLKNAKHIITISNSTKNGILDYYNIDNDKITVVYCGVDNNLFYYEKNIKKLKKLLVVGAHLEHKNIHELLENYRLWKDDYTLDIIARESPYLTKLKSIIEKNEINDKVNIILNIDDNQLVSLYRQAHALIYPSFDEGFGMPPLEAMNVGTAVVASDIPVHREVCGDAAIYISPGKVETWEEAFDSLKKGDLVDELINLGLVQAKKFSWDRSAHQLTDIFQSIYDRA